MSEEAQLYAACVASPNETTPRLMYADWLEEHYPQDDCKMAHVEWIRLVCSKATKKTNLRRQAGEIHWIRNNTRRLWPALNRFIFNAPRKTTKLLTIEDRDNMLKGTSLYLLYHMQFLTGKINIKLPVLSDELKHTSASVCFRVNKGIVTSATIGFLRGCQFAGVIAMDEPHAQIRFDCIPRTYMTFESRHINHWHATKNGFYKRGWEEVWNKLSGEAFPLCLTDDIASSKKYSSLEAMTDDVNKCLTEWAREKAKNG